MFTFSELCVQTNVFKQQTAVHSGASRLKDNKPLKLNRIAPFCPVKADRTDTSVRMFSKRSLVLRLHPCGNGLRGNGCCQATAQSVWGD